MLKKFKLLFNFMHGSKGTYVMAVISVLLMTVFASIAPLVIKITIDSIIGKEPLNLPHWLNKLIQQQGGLPFLRNNLWLILVSLVTITVFQGTFMYLKGKLSAAAAQNSSKRVREKLFNHLEHLPFDYHVKAQTGDIVQRCTSDIETVQNFISGQFVEALQIIMQVIVVLIIMFSMSPQYTLISIILIPIVFVITVRFFINMMKIFLQTDEAEGHMSAALQENLTGVRVVKAFGAQKFEMDKFDEKNQNFRQLNLKIVRLMANFWAGTDLICMSQHALVIAVGTYWATQGHITIGTIIAFSSYAGMLVWPLRGLGQMMGFMGQCFVSLGRINEILDAKPEDYKQGRNDHPIEGEIVFDDVHFEYEKDKPVLDGVSFKVEKGQTVAILGSTGSGKSSLVHLLLRLYDYQKGHVLIDGVELSELSREWIRKHVGIVLQEPFLFSKTITENIKIGDFRVQDHDVHAAAQTASVHDAILEFEKGYDTIVGERGVTLSGGQRQRIAIARTVARDVPILIFDDSLSAVDTETDAQIRQALRERRKETTTIIISHRITTLAEADKILVLDKGRIVESGSHEELIQHNGLYRKIWDIQSSLGDDLDDAV
ncbi:MAG: ABC transporter ATP-binding protein/permease [Clostridia bacterium]|nr:ABC transporter ATP-binding protein/permease [Clostridia bacterium]